MPMLLKRMIKLLKVLYLRLRLFKSSVLLLGSIAPQDGKELKVLLVSLVLRDKRENMVLMVTQDSRGAGDIVVP